MVHKHAQRLDFTSYEKKTMTLLSIFLIFNHEREATLNPKPMIICRDTECFQTGLTFFLFLSYLLGFQISIKKPRVQRRRKIQRWNMSLAQPAVNESEYCSTSHSDLIFGNSCQQLKKQNVLAVRRCLWLQPCNGRTNKYRKKIEPSGSQKIFD